MGSHHSSHDHHVTGHSLELSRSECASIPGSEFLEYEFESRSMVNAENVLDTKREFLVFRPPSVKAQTERHNERVRPPLILCLHGTDMSMWTTHLRIQEDGSHALLELAERESVLLIFGQAKLFTSPKMKSQEIRQWGQHGKERDLIYVTELIDKAIHDFAVDPDRIYVIGFSLGGIFTADISARLSDRVTAVCNWCGGIPTPRKWMDAALSDTALRMRPDLSVPSRKMPVYLITAEKDINKVEVDGAKLEYEKHAWPIIYENQPGRDHNVYADKFEDIWKFLSQYRLCKGSDGSD